MSTETLVVKFEALSPTAQAQVEMFMDFLTEQSKSKRKHRKPGFKFSWEGGLGELKEEFTAVELQHQINELR